MYVDFLLYLAFEWEAGEMGWWGWGWGGGRKVFSSVSLPLCMSWTAAINLGYFSSFKISKFIYRRLCLYLSLVKTIVVSGSYKCSKDQY